MLQGTITINIGDALQYWSDDRLKSTFHRVRVPRGDDEYKVAALLCFAQRVLVYVAIRSDCSFRSLHVCGDANLLCIH